MNTADVLETAVVFAGLNGLTWPALIATGKLRTPGQSRTPRTPKSPAARADHDSALSTPAAAKPEPVLPGLRSVSETEPAVAQAQPAEPARRATRPAVARSTRNPGLAKFAASRPRHGNGQFTPLGRAS